MLTPAQRQAKIEEWLEREGSIRLSDLAARLGVSLMTVHRDTAELKGRGALAKTHGSVQRPAPTSRTVALCPQCRTPVLDRLRFSFENAAGETVEACCGHCAFMLATTAAELASLLATDYFYGRVMSAHLAHYVVHSRVAVCCKPSVLPFLTEDDAEDFARAFGGEVHSLEGAREGARA